MLLIECRKAIAASALASAVVCAAAGVAGAGLLMPAGADAAPLAEQPATTVSGKKDGRFVLQTDLSGMTASNIASFIVLGKEAAASGRPRDAEVAFLMACRVADKLLGMDSAESADAKYQLGWLYGRLVLEEGGASARQAELRRRAGRLYADSLRSYQARYGPSHEKTRFAAQGLAALNQTTSLAPQGTSKPSREFTPPAQSRQEAAALPTPGNAGEPSAPAQPGPSFDCAKARSVPERLICSDAELARLDRELGRLYAQAKEAAPDGAAFARQNSQEWRRREATCRDRQCLLRWYATRREQLADSLQGQPARPGAAPASR